MSFLDEVARTNPSLGPTHIRVNYLYSRLLGPVPVERAWDVVTVNDL